MSEKKKTLEEAIGCWTTDPGALPRMGTLIRASINCCRRITRSTLKPPAALMMDLQLLRKRLAAAVELTESAIARCETIMKHDEVKWGRKCN